MGAPAPITPEAVRSGARDAVAAWFVRDRPKLIALACRFVSADEAEDVVQDAFLSMLRHGHAFRGEAAPTTWMHRVTVNAALMRLRTRRRRPAESLDALPPNVAEGLSTTEANHQAGIERSEAKSELDGALSHVKALDRRILSMRFVDEYSTEETARAVGLSLAATKTRLCRAKSALRNVLRGDAALEAT